MREDDYYHVFEIQFPGGMRHCVLREGDTAEDARIKLPGSCQCFGLVESYPTRLDADKFINTTK
jgi:hypothetical protein